MLVSAGPGTGKTAVACARVARLITEHDVEPSAIWLISFTRTAIREIRDRIAGFLDDPEDAHVVNLATLDSSAWRIHVGFDPNARFPSYEENIAKVLDLVRSDEEVADHLANLRHLLVDEAQDIVGTRSDLVVDMIGKLEPDAGVTVFADDAQAIYGFADDQEVRSGGDKEPPLSGLIRRGAAGVFVETELSSVHRTQSRRLRNLFSTSRQRLLDEDAPPDDRLAAIREDVRQLAHGRTPHAGSAGFPNADGDLVLYRRRCDVLMASSFLSQARVPYRLRMSGLPERLAPWIAAALSEFTSPRLGRGTFMDLWTTRVEGTPLATCTPTTAWQHLFRIAGSPPDLVDMNRLRQSLGGGRPPADLCLPDLGTSGPVIGTIHASKGREADSGHLMLPRDVRDAADGAEEARVVFVGATRGRSKLFVGSGYGQFARRTRSGRVYRRVRKNQPRAQVEIGRDGDLVAQGVAGRAYCPDADEVRLRQAAFARLANGGGPLIATADRDNCFAYRVAETDGSECLAVLAKGVNDDLFEIGAAIQREDGGPRRRPPDRIPHLYCHGLRTIVLRPDSPDAESLHEPWSRTGIVLVPVFVGYTTLNFPAST